MLLGSRKRKRHRKSSTGRPADRRDPFTVDSEPRALQFNRWELVSGPSESVTDIRHWAFYEVDFRTKPIIDANRQKPIVQEEFGLLSVDLFTGEQAVTSAVYHKCFQLVSVAPKNPYQCNVPYQLGV